jgi:hypothetical protein
MLCRPPLALAQEPTESAAPPAAAPPAPAQRLFSQQELDQILAPIALYPDALLAQILMASTYPFEVVQAARWLKAHPNLKGEELQAALQEQTWDPSVKGLTSVPQVLAMMDEKLDWTQKLGDAFLSQEQAVMDTIQSLRARAQAAGHLASTPQQTVVTQGQQISIVPATPGVIYVPVYDCGLVYGPWWWPAPPYCWYPPGYVVYGPFLYFGIGLIVGAAIWGACDWGHHTVVVNVTHYNTYNHAHRKDFHWSHEVDHRRGVPYRDDATRQRFGRILPGAELRHDFRGYEQRGEYPAGAPRPTVEQIQSELARPSAPAPGRPAGGQRIEPPAAVGAPAPAPGAQPARPPAPPRAEPPAAVGAPAPGAQPARPPAPPRAQPPAAVGAPAPAPGVQPARPPALPRAEPPVAAPRPVTPPSAGQRVPPAFESFGRGDAARVYSNRGAASRGVPQSAPPAGAARGHR